MNKKYLTVPAILAAICVSSGALIGGVHALTSWYMETHKKEGAPEEIEALYNDGSTFKEVADFEPYDVIGAAFKVKITAVYEVIRGGNKVGYAYLVNGGKPVNTETIVAVSFEGDVTEETKASLQPKAINLVVAGDSGYEKKPEDYVASLKGGEALTEVWTGGTSKSGQSIHDALIAARDDYARLWNGSTGPVVVDETEVYLKKVVSNLKSYEKDETFEGIKEDWDEKTDGINIDILYKVTTEDDQVIDVYHSKSYAKIVNEEIDPPYHNYIEMLTSWTMEITETTAIEDVTFDKYTKVKSNMEYSQWDDVYMPGIGNGSKDIDVDADTKTGATCASLSLQETLKLERNHYFNAKKSA
ncbi:MAG: hypothetical protein J6328_04445 [Bacilli bacterium]|nr:hypothetical protein [Bacilli bacterium]